MNTQGEITPDGLWPTTELEATARDIVDIGIWEAAEEEELLCLDAARAGIHAAAITVDTTNAPVATAEDGSGRH